jgi:hypothetical protein
LIAPDYVERNKALKGGNPSNTKTCNDAVACSSRAGIVLVRVAMKHTTMISADVAAAAPAT